LAIKCSKSPMLLFTSKNAPHTMTFFGRVAHNKCMACHQPNIMRLIMSHINGREATKLFPRIGVVYNTE